MLKMFAFYLGIICTFSCENPVRETKSADKDLLAIQKDTLIPNQNDGITLDFLTGRFDPSKMPGFVKIDAAHTDKTDIYLQKEVYDQFLKMHQAASHDSIHLVIKSATRNFEAQKRIWERKWSGLEAKGLINEREMALEILKFSSMPGTSRHHWGTDIDLNSLDNVWFDSPEGQKLYAWLAKNAPNYGFCQPYTARNIHRPTGYEEEKWHWSYLPLSNKYLHAAKGMLTDEMIKGFKGSGTATTIGIVEKYVMGINQACK